MGWLTSSLGWASSPWIIVNPEPVRGTFRTFKGSWIIRRQEDLIKNNSTWNFSLASKARELEHHLTSQNAIAMNILLKTEKKQIQELEDECAHLRSMVFELNKGFFAISNKPSVGFLPGTKRRGNRQPTSKCHGSRQARSRPSRPYSGWGNNPACFHLILI